MKNDNKVKVHYQPRSDNGSDMGVRSEGGDQLTRGGDIKVYWRWRMEKPSAQLTTAVESVEVSA